MSSIKFIVGGVYKGYDLVYAFNYLFIVAAIESKKIYMTCIDYPRDDFPPSVFLLGSAFADRAKFVVLTPYTGVADLQEHYPELFI